MQQLLKYFRCHFTYFLHNSLPNISSPLTPGAQPRIAMSARTLSMITPREEESFPIERCMTLHEDHEMPCDDERTGSDPKKQKLDVVPR